MMLCGATAASGVPDMFICPPAFTQRPGEKGMGTVCSVLSSLPAQGLGDLRQQRI